MTSHPHPYETSIRPHFSKIPLINNISKINFIYHELFHLRKSNYLNKILITKVRILNFN